MLIAPSFVWNTFVAYKLIAVDHHIPALASWGAFLHLLPLEVVARVVTVVSEMVESSFLAGQLIAVEGYS